MGSTVEAQKKLLKTKPKVSRGTGTDEDITSLGKILSGELPSSIPRTTGRWDFPINPDTGLPWTEEERGPIIRTPKPGGVNPETGESYPSMGYTTGDKAGSHSSTMEYVIGRDGPGTMEEALELIQPEKRNKGGIVRKTRVF